MTSELLFVPRYPVGDDGKDLDYGKLFNDHEVSWRRAYNKYGMAFVMLCMNMNNTYSKERIAYLKEAIEAEFKITITNLEFSKMIQAADTRREDRQHFREFDLHFRRIQSAQPTAAADGTQQKESQC